MEDLWLRAQLGLPLEFGGSVAILLDPAQTADRRGQAIANSISRFPRLRYMGSKYKLAPALAEVFSGVSFETVLDGFSGSGVVSYLLKTMGKTVTSNDFLLFPATVAVATVENPGVRLGADDVELLLSPNRDGRDFILSTFRSLYFPDADHEFLDSAWSHIESLPAYKRELAIAALCLAAARKQPRGVFTVTSFRYDDGRRSLRMPLRDLFVEAVRDYNSVIVDGGPPCVALCDDILEVPASGFDLVYLDPPYAPPRDDNDYIKRYHFLEGLAGYWRDQTIMHETVTKKLAKRFTPFAYKRTIRDGLRKTVERFAGSTIILSYSTNSVPDEPEVIEILREFKANVQVYAMDHRYSFGTHATAARRLARELIFIAT